MDRAEELRAVRGATSVKFMKFMRIRSASTGALICFFEGEDQKYYGVRLEAANPKLEWHGINCGGKKQVLELYALITRHESYNTSFVAFFVDRDFDEPIPAEMRSMVYETPVYSIENLYVEESCMDAILASEFKIDQFDEDAELYHRAIECYRKRLSEFHEAVKHINVWIRAHRKREKTEGSRPLNLNNVNLDKLTNVYLDKIEKILEEGKIGELFPGCYEISAAELEEAERAFDFSASGQQFRGKFEIEFVRYFLLRLKEASHQHGSLFHRVGRVVKLQLTKANIVSELSQYAATPNCLREFIATLSAKVAAV